jgi:hypothetical protein
MVLQTRATRSLPVRRLKFVLLLQHVTIPQKFLQPRNIFPCVKFTGTRGVTDPGQASWKTLRNRDSPPTNTHTTTPPVAFFRLQLHRTELRSGRLFTRTATTRLKPENRRIKVTVRRGRKRQTGTG